MFDFLSSSDDDLDEDQYGADLTSAAVVYCPYCGESVEIPVDQAGGEVQEYVEDCAVCCQPWSVRVSVDGDGVASVLVSTLDGD